MAGNVDEWTSIACCDYPYHVTDGREHRETANDRVVALGSATLGSCAAYRFARELSDDGFLFGVWGGGGHVLKRDLALHFPMCQYAYWRCAIAHNRLLGSQANPHIVAVLHALRSPTPFPHDPGRFQCRRRLVEC
jgi:hypothetical protein